MPDPSEASEPWTKPRLPSVSLLGLYSFREALDPGLIFLDVTLENSGDTPCKFVAEKMLERLQAQGRVLRGKEQLAQTSFVESLSAIEETAVVARAHSVNAGRSGRVPASPLEDGQEVNDVRSLSRVDPLKPEADEDLVHILVDSAEWLDEDAVCLARFSSDIHTGLEEDQGEGLRVSSRFLLICLSGMRVAGQSRWLEANARGSKLRRHVEIGEAAATMFQDEAVVRAAYNVTHPQGMIAAVDACLRDLKVVPKAKLPDEEAVIRRARQMLKQMMCSMNTLNQRERWAHAQQSAFKDGFSISGMLGFMQTFAVPLLSGIALALILANSYAEFYDEWTGHGPRLGHDEGHRRLGGGEKDTRPSVFGWEVHGHAVTLHFIVNDILMCLFFGLAGKEITEAFQPGGSLYPPTRSTVNVLAATAGGVVGPIAVYLVLVSFGYSAGLLDNSLSLAEYTIGWGVPTATDISLAWVTAICVFGAGHPAINYLLLLAIIDDGIGLMIIAFAYPDPHNPMKPQYLLLILAAMMVSCILRGLRCARWQLYVVLAGPLSWAGLLFTGLHPALALVFVVPFIPLHVQTDILTMESGGVARSHGGDCDMGHQKGRHPLHEYEESVKNFIDFFVLFLFGTVNAGVRVDGAGWLTVIVLLSLVVGKTLGILLSSQVATCCGCPPPAGMTRASVTSVGFIASAGLTVALFVSGEAFADAPGLATQSKMGALLSALVAFVAIGASVVQARLAKGRTRQMAAELDETGPDAVVSSGARMDTTLEDMVVNHAVRSLNLVHDATSAIESRAGLPRRRTLELLKASMQEDEVQGEVNKKGEEAFAVKIRMC